MVELCTKRIFLPAESCGIYPKLIISFPQMPVGFAAYADPPKLVNIEVQRLSTKLRTAGRVCINDPQLSGDDAA
jgi:hypothetical protein